MGQAAEKRENLSDRCARLRSAIRRADAAVYEVCTEIVFIADHWDDYRDEAGCEAGPWVRKVDPRRSLSWYREIHAASEKLGRDAECVTWDAARWLAKVMTKSSDLPKVKGVLRAAYREEAQRSLPLTIRQCRVRLSELVPHAPSFNRSASVIEQLKERVAMLEQLLAERGITIP